MSTTSDATTGIAILDNPTLFTLGLYMYALETLFFYGHLMWLIAHEDSIEYY
jgi:hypothetical protein